MDTDQSLFLLNVKPEDLDEQGRFICDHKTMVVGVHAFDDVKYQLSYVKLSGVNLIEERAFENCLYLKNVDIDYDTEYGQIRIKDGAFKNCTSLQRFVIPNFVSFYKSPFENCTNLREIVIQGMIDYNLEEFNPPSYDSSEEEIEAFNEKIRNTDWSEVLSGRVFKKSDNIERISIEGDAEYGFNVFRGFKNLKEINIKGFRASRDFWRDAIMNFPEAYLLLPTCLYNDTNFLRQCWSAMNRCLLSEYGENGYKYGKRLIIQKIKIEDRKQKQRKIEEKLLSPVFDKKRGGGTLKNF